MAHHRRVAVDTHKLQLRLDPHSTRHYVSAMYPLYFMCQSVPVCSGSCFTIIDEIEVTGYWLYCLIRELVAVPLPICVP
jgi:hypothetical protein